MFRYEPAIIDSHFNFVGYASTLVKKGANESFAVTKYFRDISIEPIETIKEDQVDIDPGESSKCNVFRLFGPLLICVFIQDNLVEIQRLVFQKL